MSELSPQAEARDMELVPTRASRAPVRRCRTGHSPGRPPCPHFAQQHRRSNFKQNKDIRVTVRLTPEQYASISARAETAQMTPSAYIRAAAMRHKVTVVDGLKELAHELKGLGRNLNQLTMLAHQGRFSAPDLHGMIRTLERVYDRLDELAGQERC